LKRNSSVGNQLADEDDYVEPGVESEDENTS